MGLQDVKHYDLQAWETKNPEQTQNLLIEKNYRYGDKNRESLLRQKPSRLTAYIKPIHPLLQNLRLFHDRS